MLLRNMPEITMKKIAISGTIGSGKTSCIQILREMGYNVINADDIVKDLKIKDNVVYNDLLRLYNNKFLNDNLDIDNKKLADYMFIDSKNKKEIEDIILPRVKEVIENHLNSNSDELIFVEVPLLYEMGWESMFDKVWVVYVDDQLALNRLKEYRNIDEIEAKKRLQQQMSLSDKNKYDNVMINNNGSLKELRIKIKQLLDKE